MSLTAESVKLFLGYEESENDPAVLLNIEMLIAASDLFVKAAVGADYPEDDARMQLVRQQYISEMHDNRELSAKTENRLRDMARAHMRQIKLEMRDET
jgi:hypothetical protein